MSLFPPLLTPSNLFYTKPRHIFTSSSSCSGIMSLFFTQLSSSPFLFSYIFVFLLLFTLTLIFALFNISFAHNFKVDVECNINFTFFLLRNCVMLKIGNKHFHRVIISQYMSSYNNNK